MKQFNQLSPQAQTTIIQTLLSLYTGDLPQHVKDEIAEWKIYSTTVQPQQTTEEPYPGFNDAWGHLETNQPQQTVVGQWGRPKALPCPFCGEEGHKPNGKIDTRFKHKDTCYLACFWKTSHHVVLDEEVELWNSRVERTNNASTH